MRYNFFLVLVLSYICFGSASAKNIQINSSPFIPRELFFLKQNNENPQISKDGKFLSVVSAEKNGEFCIKIGKESDSIEDYKAIVKTNHYIRKYFWAYNNRDIIYSTHDVRSDAINIHSIDVKNNKYKNLTPFNKIQAKIIKISPKFPSKILVGINRRDSRYHDVFELNIDTGEKKLKFLNADCFFKLIYDDDYNLRFTYKTFDNDTIIIYKFDTKGEKQPLLSLHSREGYSTHFLDFDESGNIAFMENAKSFDIPRLMTLDTRTNHYKTLLTPKKGELWNALFHPKNKKIQAVSVNYDKLKWIFFDEQMKKDFMHLESLHEGIVKIESRSFDDNKWVVNFISGNHPESYYLYDRKNKILRMLFSKNPDLSKYQLPKMHPVEIKTRDGLTMLCYLIRPTIYSNKKPPLIIHVHGGPISRDSWNFNNLYQFLVDRGYSVLSVNYRGSSGFGKAFTEAGTGEWGRKMQDDLVDAANWAIKNNIANKNELAILGASYGGYAALMGATYTPDVFACGISVSGISNLVTSFKSKPSSWHYHLSRYKSLIGGNPETKEGRKKLLNRSPITYAKNLKIPLLMIHGKNDTTVTYQESEQMADKTQNVRDLVTYALIDGEGHSFKNRDNVLAYHALIEQFLGSCLGNSYEPMGDLLEKSSILLRQEGILKK